MKKPPLLLAIVAVLFTALYIILPPRHKTSSFEGNKTFSFCGKEKTGYYINHQGSCNKFCRHITGKDCGEIKSKAQKLEEGICYSYHPQVMMGDPCIYCSVQCINPEKPTYPYP